MDSHRPGVEGVTVAGVDIAGIALGTVLALGINLVLRGASGEAADAQGAPGGLAAAARAPRRLTDCCHES